MKRELKFRAWNKEINKMHEWPFIIHFFDEEIRVTLPDRSKTMIYPFSSVEIMQFTGLEDKNGKEIYEGDIIKAMGPDMKEVKNIEVTGMCYAPEMKEAEKEGRLEIIGNVFENPDLLK